MPIEFPCPQCRRPMRTPDETAGKKGQCPQCGAVVQIPSAPPAEQVKAPAGEATMELTCPGCQRILRVPAASAGKQGKCPHCSIVVQIPAPGGAAAGAPIQFNCPSCQRLVRTPANTAGKQGQCPQCQGVIQIPLASTASGASAGAGPLDDLFRSLPAAEAARPFAAASSHVPPGWADPKRAARAKKKYQAKQPKPRMRRDWGSRDGLPWEQSSVHRRFMGTITKLLFSPNHAFNMMQRSGGVGRPLAFAICGLMFGYFVNLAYLIVLAAIGVAISIWRAPNPASVDYQQLAIMAGVGLASYVVLGVVWSVVGGIVGSFINGAVTHLALHLLDEANGPFETTYRVAAYTLGAMGCLLIVPLIGWLLPLVAYPITMTLGLINAQEATGPRAAGAVALSYLLGCALGAALLFALFSLLTSLLPPAIMGPDMLGR